MNVNEKPYVEIWQPEILLEQFAPSLLMEKVANEMDPDLVLIRLGSAIDKSQLTDKSAPISNVKDQDTFSVSFHRTNFEKKREAQAFSKLSGGTKT